MEEDDIGVGFTLGKEWSDLKAKIQVLQELLERIGGNKMCKYCEGKNIITIENYLAVYINYLSEINILTTDGEFKKKINYCPMCGRKLGWEEIRL
jgi:hypothetical protein